MREAQRVLCLGIILAAFTLGRACAEPRAGFTKLFDGKTLTGWKLIGGVGPGYVPKDGILECPKDGGGNLVTEREYSDFTFKFDFRLHHGSNNGVGIRTPLEGNLSYTG